MNITNFPKKLTGSIRAIPSKSQAHRLLICAAFSDQPTALFCPQTNEDIEATADCLRALGARILRTEDGYHIHPIENLPRRATLNCRESGSTLRFMLPVCGALGVDATFTMAGRLPQRPLSPLWEELERHGCSLCRPTGETIRCSGKLRSGQYTIVGNISSQYITGLLFAMTLMDGHSSLEITGKLESEPYVEMTRRALSVFGVSTADNTVSGSFPFSSPGAVAVEGDWSNAAFFLTAQAIGNPVTVTNLEPESPQGDRAVVNALSRLKTGHCQISAADIPDLVPILSVAAASMHGCEFTDIARLRLKESDRVASVIAMLAAFGIEANATEDTLSVFPGQFHGGIVDTVNDHRIAMSAAIAATMADDL